MRVLTEETRPTIISQDVMWLAIPVHSSRKLLQGERRTTQPGKSIDLEALDLDSDEDASRPGASTDLKVLDLEDADDETDMGEPGSPHQGTMEAINMDISRD